MSGPHLRISASSAPVRDTPGHIALAEGLGFDAAWRYDSPLLYHDAFTTLARGGAHLAHRPGGGNVVVPGLRAPVATAAALASVSALAPGGCGSRWGRASPGDSRWASGRSPWRNWSVRWPTSAACWPGTSDRTWTVAARCA